MIEGHTQEEHERTGFESELRNKIHQLEHATVESVFGPNTSGPTFEYQVGGRQAIDRLATWMRSFTGSPERRPLLELPAKQLLEIQQFESRWSQQPTEGSLLRTILTQHPEWIPLLASFGEAGASLDQWLKEDPSALTSTRNAFESYERFSQNLARDTDDFFKPGKSPSDRYLEHHLQAISDESQFYRMKGQARQENKKIAQPTRDKYWQKIEEALSARDTEMLDRLSQEMSEQTTIFNKLFSAAVRSEYKITLEDLKDVEVEEQNTLLAQEDRADMERMVTENWESHPDLMTDMMDSLNIPKAGSTFYLLKKEGQVIAFLRSSDYKNEDEEGLWLGMLNVDSRYKGHAVATAFTKEMVALLGEDCTLFADVFPTIEAGTMYVERLGFQIVGISDPKKTDDPAKQRLLLKREAEGDQRQEQVIRTQREAFRIPEDATLMIRIVDKLTGQGKIGTIYETDPKDPNVRWITFSTLAEKRSEPEPKTDLKQVA